jgi:hypothetical protein
MFLNPYLSLEEMQRRLTREMFQSATALSEDGNWVWENYLAWCWINRLDARAWFERQNIEPPSVLVERPVFQPALALPSAGGLAQADKPFLREMAELINSGHAMSIEAAALHVAPPRPWTRHREIQSDAIGEGISETDCARATPL